MVKRLTEEEVLRRIEGRGIRLDGEYVGGTNNKQPLECETCGHRWSTRPNSVFGGCGCPSCAGNAPVTYEEVLKRLEGRGIRLDGEYVGRTQPDKQPLECVTCGHHWSPVLNDVFQGSGCPACAGNAPVTYEEVLKRLEGRSIRLDGEYVGGVKKKKQPLECGTCGYYWSAALTNVFRGDGCPSCAGNAPVTYEEVLKRLEGRGIRLDGEYVGRTQPDKQPLECVTCGHHWSAVLNSVFSGCGCPSCAGNAPVTYEEVLKRLEGRGIRLDGEYVGRTQPDKQPLECVTCGHHWSPVLNDVFQGSGCPACARDQWLKTGIYHLHHPEFSYQYIGISWRPSLRLLEHQEDEGDKGELARVIDTPEELTFGEVYDLLDAAWEEDRLPTQVQNWFESAPHGNLPPGRLWFIDWEAMPHGERQQAARVPRFVAEWVETEMIRQLSDCFEAANPFHAAGKFQLVNQAKNKRSRNYA
jgi:predicted  nucleic acid-binding Zn-ribbon protein